MKRFTDFFRVLGFSFLFVLGTAVLDSHADRGGGCSPKSPLRGTWGWHQFVPFIIPPGSSTPFPVAVIGNLTVDECSAFVGHGFLNAPSFVEKIDFTGTCETPEDGLFKCTIPTFANEVRACVVTAHLGGCISEFYCVVGDATIEPLEVLIVEFKRQTPGTCT